MSRRQPRRVAVGPDPSDRAVKMAFAQCLRFFAALPARSVDDLRKALLLVADHNDPRPANVTTMEEERVKRWFSRPEVQP